MPYCIVIWKRGSNSIDIAGLKPDDLKYLEKIPCLANRVEIGDSEGFIRFGPSVTPCRYSNNTAPILPVKPAVVLTGLEVLGFKVITTTAAPVPSQKLTPSTEYSWTLRREFSEPEPQD